LGFAPNVCRGSYRVKDASHSISFEGKCFLFMSTTDKRTGKRVKFSREGRTPGSKCEISLDKLYMAFYDAKVAEGIVGKDIGDVPRELRLSVRLHGR
jgi:hypothetical protein